MPSAKQQSLGAMVVSHLRATTAGNDWDPDTLAQLQRVLLHCDEYREASQDVDDAAQALRQWLDTIPEEVATRIDTLLPQENVHFLACLLPALCVWARPTSWGQDIEISNVTSAAIELLNEPIGSDVDRIRATQAAARALRDTVALARSPNDAWGLVGPWLVTGHSLLWPVAPGLWDKQKHLLPTFIESWIATGEAAAVVDAKRQADTVSTPLLVRWQNKLKSSIQLLNETEEATLMARAMTALIDDDTKMALCRLVQATAWLDPVVQSALLRVLPKEESARLPKLPWYANDAPANRSVTFAYAPHLASLLDSMGDSTVWSDAPMHGAMVKALVDAQEPGIDPMGPVAGDVFESIEPT